MLVWLIVQLLGAVLCVVLPFVMQAKESLHPPMNTPSLGTFGIIMMTGFFFVAAGLVNGVIVGDRLGWPWFGTGVLCLGAAAAGAAASYYLLYAMASKGGVTLTLAGGAGLSLLLAANLVAPWVV